MILLYQAMQQISQRCNT